MLLGGTLAFILSIGLATGATAASPPVPAANFDPTLYSRPHQMVEVAPGRRVNLTCTGSGSPVVMLVSGIGAGSEAWRNVQGEIAKYTRVCAYDRAGYGFSDALAGEADATSAVADLAHLLDAGGVAQPVVLVAHSAGALYSQFFSGEHPEKVAGAVLVDPTGLNDFRDVDSILTEDERARKKANYPRMFESLDRCVDRARSRAGTSVGEAGTECDPPSTGAPDLDEALRRQFADPKVAEANRSEMRNFNPPDADAIESATTRQVRQRPFLLGDKPLIVLKTGGRLPPGERGERLRALSDLETRRLLAASTEAKALHVKSGHAIQDERPDVVVAAVREVVDSIRTKTR